VKVGEICALEEHWKPVLWYVRINYNLFPLFVCELDDVLCSVVFEERLYLGNRCDWKK
jgi:hypothetical protein